MAMFAAHFDPRVHHVTSLLACLVDVPPSRAGWSSSSGTSATTRTRSGRAPGATRSQSGHNTSSRHHQNKTLLTDVTAHAAVDAHGMVVHVVGRGKATHTTLSFPRSCFVNFQVRDDADHEVEADGGDHSSDTITFSFDALSVVECLRLLGSSHAHTSGGRADERAVTLSHDPADGALKLTLEERGVFTTCDVAVLDLSDDVDFLHAGVDARAAFRGAPTVCKLICASSLLKDAFADLDDFKTPTITVSFSPKAPHFRASVKSASFGSIEIDVPRSAFTTFDPPQNTLATTFRKDGLLRGLKPLAHADDTLLAINDRGMLQIQHIARIPNSVDDVLFEYFCCSTFDDDDDDDDEVALDEEDAERQLWGDDDNDVNDDHAAPSRRVRARRVADSDEDDPPRPTTTSSRGQGGHSQRQTNNNHRSAFLSPEY